MKKLLTLFILLSALQSNGQNTFDRKQKSYYDTISVWLNVVKDTSIKYSLMDGVIGFPVYAVRVYSVYITEYVPEHQSGDILYLGEMARRFIKYLDQRKQPFTKNLIIIP